MYVPVEPRRIKRKDLRKRKKNVNKPCVKKRSVQKETGLVSAEDPQKRDSGGDWDHVTTEGEQVQGKLPTVEPERRGLPVSQ